MKYLTKEGIEVFNVLFNYSIHTYDLKRIQLSNRIPKIGEKCAVSLEHDHDHFVTVKSFNPDSQYPLNGEYKYGAVPLENGFYGVAVVECDLKWLYN